MYGERDEPFEVLARMGERLEATLTPEMVYPTIVETVSQTLKLPYAAIAVLRQGRLQTVEAYGKPTADVVAFPLTYQGEPVGRLLVARRAPGEPFGDNDARILRNIALQAGAAVHAVQLLADLQQSRQQLVTAREEERRRLRRDLHDGLGPQLASQTLTIDAIDKMLTRDPKRARALLKDLKAQSRDAISDIRRLVDNLRPPALDELGLITALREIAARHQTHGLAVTVVAGPMPPLPAAVEVAVFRVVQEALTNVVRHAEATACTVRLVVTAAGLLLTIEDNGRGLPAELQSGVGFQSMRERAAELGGSWQAAATPGGGVQVRASFPLSSRDMAAETDGLV
jgi:signal transduction histidine kinase